MAGYERGIEMSKLWKIRVFDIVIYCLYIKCMIYEFASISIYKQKAEESQ